MSRADGVQITELKNSSSFGDYFDMASLRAEDGKFPTGIIVAIQRGGGFEPVSLLLPHQLYSDVAQRLISTYGAKELWVYPIFDSQAWTQVVL